MSKLRFASRLSSFGVASVLHPTCCHTVNLKFTGYGKKITILQCPMSSLDLFSSFNDTRLVQYKTYYGMFDVSIFMINTPHTRTWIVYYEKLEKLGLKHHKCNWYWNKYPPFWQLWTKTNESSSLNWLSIKVNGGPSLFFITWSEW